MVSRKLAERRATLEKLFEEAGCTGESLTSQKVRSSKEPNVICTLKGNEADAGAIVVGGHFDLVDYGMGAVDDWSGAVLLPSLYQSLKSAPRKHDFVFIAFAAEETGLNGSHEYVRKLTREQRGAIRAMVNLECLGMTPPKVWASRADPSLLEAYWKVVAALKLQMFGVNVERVGDDDTHPFRDAKIPTISIHSITQETFPILHSKRDQVAAIHPEMYYDAYRVAATLLAYLDTTQ
jgi:Zn-dependent M28 family amino/carboxypeptidase